MRTWPWVIAGVALFFSFLVARANSNGGGLIAKLGSKSYATREKASKELAEKMTFELYQKLRNLAITDLEVRFRVGLALYFHREKLAQEYVANLRANLEGGYPQYPWICLNGGYNYGCCYLHGARLMGAPQDNNPKWTDWREATKLWTEDEICAAVENYLNERTSEKEFRCKMDCKIEAIKENVHRMIKMEDNFWGGKEKNPLRKAWKYDQ